MEKLSEDNTGLDTKRDDDIPEEVLNMSDDDPRLLKFMEEVEEERRKRHPNQTHEELIKNVEAKLNAQKHSN